MDRSLASRQLSVAMGHEERRAERLSAALEEAKRAQVAPEELREAEEMLEVEPPDEVEMIDISR